MLALADFLALSQQVLWVPFTRRGHGDGVTDNTLFVDDHGGAVGNALVFQKNPIFLGHVPFGMEVLQKRERNPAQRLRPIVMGKSAIDAHTQNLGVTGLELVLEGFESRHLLASGGCPIQGIEHQHNVLLPLELAQGELRATQMANQLKIGGLLTNLDHDDFSSFDLNLILSGPAINYNE